MRSSRCGLRLQALRVSVAAISYIAAQQVIQADRVSRGGLISALDRSRGVAVYP